MSFDWTKVEGYRDDMSAEEKLNLLDNYSEPEPDPVPTPTPTPTPTPVPSTGSKSGSGVVSKAQFDKVSSELAAMKKQLRSRMSEDEQREADRQVQQAAIEEELKTLRRDKALSVYKAAFLSQGYEEALAGDAATSLVDGDTDAMFDAMRKHTAALEKSLRAKILKETPVPPAGTDVTEEAKRRKEDASLREAFGLPPLK